MSISEQFDEVQYGSITVDLNNHVFKIQDEPDKKVKLTRQEANILANFIALKNERASLKTMVELLGATEGSFKAMLTYARNKVSTIEITEGVTADVLFLSDRLIGESDNEKLPYSFNTELADLITKHGLGFDSELLRGVRTESTRTVGRLSNTGEFLIGTP